MTDPRQERRGYDRRVGLPDTRPQEDRVERRRAIVDRRQPPPRSDLARDRWIPGRTPREEQAALVRQIAADPSLMDWLRRHVASRYEALAGLLEAGGHPAAAQRVRAEAAAHRAGDTSLW